MKLELTIETGTQQGLVLVKEQRGTYRIGRAAEAELALTGDEYASRYHCLIELSPDGAMLRDNRSRAGTFVNGRLVKEAQLADGDTLLIGLTAVRVSLADVAPPITPIERPPVVPGFTLVKRLSMEAPGEVWWAYTERKKQLVNLHFISLLASAGAETQRRFLRQAALCARLDHPGLVRFLTQDITAEVLWFATELSEGPTLQQFVEKHGPLPANEVVAIVSQALDIVAYLHQKDVVHRSLCPDSLLVRKQSGRFSVRLADLGSAKCFQIVGLQAITRLGERGYPLHAFTAPEALTSLERFDLRSDLYALGAILYFALSGQPPYQFTASADPTSTILRTDPPPLRQLKPDLPPALVQVVEQAMARDLKARYQTAQETSQALSQALERRPIILKPDHIQLTAEIEAALHPMFSDFRQIAIEAEFGHGLSGGRVFQVRLASSGSKTHLPVVVKVAPTGLIQQEWQAYRHWVEGSLPDIARIEAPPTLAPGRSWDGLRYALAGGGVFNVESLRSYYQKASADDLRWLLEKRLFKLIGGNWWQVNRARLTFQMQADYDALLPVNLLLEATDPPAGGSEHLIEPDHLPPFAIPPGKWMQLKGFVVTEVDEPRQQLTLNLPPTPADWPTASYRLRLNGVADIQRYQVGQPVDSLYGVVKATRHSLLLTQARQALGEAIDLVAPRLPLPSLPLSGEGSLPNPLLAYPAMLQDFFKVKVSTIHGDLNLENILVDPDTRHLSLIDFVTARQGHALHDLLRLETEVVTKLVSAALAEANLSLDVLQTLYEQLHRVIFYPRQYSSQEYPHPALAKAWAMLVAIRKMARKCLFDPDDWREYYCGLTLYMLGALKFKNLDQLPTAPLPKQAAFWAAATVVALLD